MKKLLVANRGEIAVRIMRSAKEMGIATVAVFSEADRTALHVKYADEAVCIGPAASSESYLKQEKIIEAAQLTGADAIHPGYGFLSENASFARLVNKSGLIFIGPPASAIEIMGNKLAAKQAAKNYNIPMLPGTLEPVQDIEEAKKIASEIGFPVLIKAAAGGGGKGMRVIDDEASFEEQMKRAVSEAMSSFGDGSVFLEKYVASPRHIEVQVLSDSQGTHLHILERECSVQRRHQKVVEEAPSGIITPDIREKIGKSATDVARSCNYVGAGTVEFLLDENLNFYFLEMNTRLQVEHPVTEMVTGLDLVKEQIKIARGGKLEFQQEEISANGHAIELRVYAEDPANNFLPDIGKLTVYRPPSGPGIRVDSGFEEGMEIPVHYDPMIAKLIVHGANREEAIERMLRAINEFELSGVATTLSFGRFVLQHEAFRTCKYDTHFVSKYFKPELLNSFDKDEELAAALIAHHIYNNSTVKKNGETIVTETLQGSNWRRNRARTE